ncbi:MAG: M48 family metalloprotease [Bacteroidia bacterium]
MLLKKYVLSFVLLCVCTPLFSQDCKVSDWDLMFMLGKKVQSVVSETQVVSLATENQLGKEAYEKLSKQYVLRRKGKDFRKLNDIFQKLTVHCERKSLDYQLFLIEDDTTVNAFSHAGGYVYLTTGLLLQLQNDDETALIIGHELAHVDKKHCIRAYQMQLLKQKLQSEDAKLGADLLKQLIAPFDQFDEYDADWAASEYCIKAGYSPEKGMEIFKRWAQFERPDETLKLFRTHPFSKDRVCFLVKYLNTYHPESEEVKALKQKTNEK